jgi:NADH-quinone oxidoreductase subunit J
MLVLTFCFLGGLYLTLNAQFLAVVQVAVYAGAIMVLVLFVIMLLNLASERIEVSRNWKTVVGLLAACGVLAQMLAIFFARSGNYPQQLSDKSAVLGTTESIGMLLYSTYSLPFELASLILISAAVGSIILAKRRLA